MPIRRFSASLFGCLAIVSTIIASASAQTERERYDTRRTPVVRVFEATRDAVVNISTTQIVNVRDSRGYGNLFDEIFESPFRQRTREYRRESCGSGFVIHPDGYIVTNAHVVARTAERRAVFADGREFDADVVAFDSARDLAVLKITPDRPLPVLPLGRSNDLMIGETVIAIGNPLGLQTTVTTGVVSAIERDLEFSSGVSLRGLVQTDASINPGNSGGPLLNVLGELIGVNTAIRGDAQNIGFAIPVDRLREVLPDLLDVERRYGFATGFRVNTVDIPQIVSIDRGSPADEAGLRVGDVLVALDDSPVEEGVAFYIDLIGRKPGDELRLSVTRRGERREIVVPVRERPTPDGQRLAAQRLGIEIVPLEERQARRLGLRRSRGMLVTSVREGSPADQLGIREDDVLIAVSRRFFNSMADLGQVLEDIGAGRVTEVTVLRVERGGMIIRLDGELRTARS